MEVRFSGVIRFGFTPLKTPAEFTRIEKGKVDYGPIMEIKSCIYGKTPEYLSIYSRILKKFGPF